jgi:hypothetical protein
MNDIKTNAGMDSSADIEIYWEVQSGKALLVLAVSVAWAGRKITLDDFDFHFAQGVSSDDMAQDIFTLTGGSLDQQGSCGASQHLRIYYDPEWHGQLALELKNESLLTNGNVWLPRITGSEPTETTTDRAMQQGMGYLP